MPEALILVALVGAGVVYALALGRVWAADIDAVTWLEAVAFFCGLAVLAIALVSPLDGAAQRRLAVHMVQHVLLVSVAAPLLVVGRPLRVVGLARRWHWRTPGMTGQRAWSCLVAAAVLQVGVLLVWHVPFLYDAALAHDPVHGFEHITLLASAFALWFGLAQIGGEAGGATVLALFLATLPVMALGVAMTFARTVWYPIYASRTAQPLLDQQLAGVVMWAYGGLAAVIGAVTLFVRWLRGQERAFPGALTPGATARVAPVPETPPC